MPNPFPIPKFRPATEKNLEKNVVTDDDCKWIVRTMSTILMTHVQGPTMANCNIVARALVDKSKFLADDEGEGQVHAACVVIIFNFTLIFFF